MSFPAATDAAYLYISSAMARTTVATGATRLPATTAPPLARSPAGRLTPACLETSCVTAGLTAEMGGTSLRSCAVCLDFVRRLPPHVRRQSFSVETGGASARAGGVTTQQTALMAATRPTAVSETAS